jgi:hypothetical protein
MSIRAQHTEASHAVMAALRFSVKTGVKPRTLTAALTGDKPKRLGQYESREVPIRDARPFVADLSLDREGFELRRQETAVRDFYDEEELRRVYYPEVETLVREATGATRTLIFDHTIRTESGGQGAGAGGAGRVPVRQAHNDYTELSGPQRVRDLISDPGEAERLGKGRFAVINVWRPIRGPLLRAPLAVADARSVAEGDLQATDLVYPDRVGEIYELAYGPQHGWYYVPAMTQDEALLIKSYDSAKDGRARFTPHTAFDDPTMPEDAPPRESIEVRVLAFFEERET